LSITSFIAWCNSGSVFGAAIGFLLRDAEGGMSNIDAAASNEITTGNLTRRMRRSLNARSIRGPHCIANALDAKESKEAAASPQHSNDDAALLSHTMPHVTVLYFAKVEKELRLYEVTISMLERRHVILFGMNLSVAQQQPPPAPIKRRKNQRTKEATSS